MLPPCRSSDGLKVDSACKYKYMHAYVLLCYCVSTIVIESTIIIVIRLIIKIASVTAIAIIVVM